MQKDRPKWDKVNLPRAMVELVEKYLEMDIASQRGLKNRSDVAIEGVKLVLERDGVYGRRSRLEHLNMYDEYTELTNELGGDNIAGGKLKEGGTEHWESPNTGATNESGFTGLSAGWREASAGGYPTMGWDSYFWSSSEYNSYTARGRELVYNGSSVYRTTPSKQEGFSVRCLKD